MEYLDHTAVAVLAKLGDPADEGRLCPRCQVAVIHVEHWTLMEAIRSLITVGRILCLYERCTACGTLSLVVRHRCAPFTR